MFSIEERLARRKPYNGQFFTVAIDGRGSSGKTALLEYLRTLHKNFVCVHGDDYFHYINDVVVWGAFDEKRFRREIVQPLRSGRTFTPSSYNFATRRWSKGSLTHIDSAFCLERVQSFALPLDWDLKIWVETPKDTCARQGIERDLQHLPRARVLAAWKHWQKIEDAYIAEFQPVHQADIIVYGMKNFSTQII
jgi:uridine kinase